MRELDRLAERNCTRGSSRTTPQKKMTRIRILPENVANKIAAGEVVERPASVVKELLENALDAGAQSIRVEVESGGKRMIRVIDDGTGMAHDDALLAFERHATSKLRTADDLLSIATLGFRGEALPSIAAVSRLLLQTRAADEEEGTRIEFAGGKLVGVNPEGLPAGTTISVADLFYCVPARRNFLKSETTELGHIASLVTHYALAHPDKQFVLKTPTQEIITCRGRGDDGRARLPDFRAAGARRVVRDSAGFLAHARGDHGSRIGAGRARRGNCGARVCFAARSAAQQSQRNLRFREQAAGARPPDPARDSRGLPQHPAARGFPGGAAVSRFARRGSGRQRASREDRGALPASAIRARFHARLDPPGAFTRAPGSQFFRCDVQCCASPAPGAAASENVEASAAAAAGMGNGNNALPRAVIPPMNAAGATGTATASDFELTGAPLRPEAQRFQFESGIGMAVGRIGFRNRPPHGRGRGPAFLAGESAGSGDRLASAESLAELKPLGQVNSSFIVAVNGEGLWIIDQHVAHERVLFEQHLRARREGQLTGQRMLVPMMVELSPRQLVIFERIAEELAANGFEVAQMGPRSVAIHAAPAGIATSDAERLLMEILEGTDRENAAISMDTLQAKIAASTSCHAAIKVNMPLDQKKMEWLLAELAKTEAPMSCPHGRPIVLRYSVKEIERAFKRI